MEKKHAEIIGNRDGILNQALERLCVWRRSMPKVLDGVDGSHDDPPVYSPDIATKIY